MSCPVENVVCYLQDSLGEKTGVRYTTERVLAWLNLVILEVAGHRPDLWAEHKTVTLKPGCVQHLCDQCVNVTSVLYTIGNECVEPEEDNEEKTDICDFLDDTNCTRFGATEESESYAIRKYALDADEPCFLRIHGDGVPNDGQTYQAVVMCAEKPEMVDLTDEIPECLCGPYLACITWGVMARAMALNESSTNSTRSAQYLQQFYGCMQGVKNGTFAFERENYFLRGEFSNVN